MEGTATISSSLFLPISLLSQRFCLTERKWVTMLSASLAMKLREAADARPERWRALLWPAAQVAPARLRLSSDDDWRMAWGELNGATQRTTRQILAQSICRCCVLGHHSRHLSFFSLCCRCTGMEASHGATPHFQRGRSELNYHLYALWIALWPKPKHDDQSGRKTDKHDDDERSRSRVFKFLTRMPSKGKDKRKKDASAGSRTRVYCLEGNYPNRWTTDAFCFNRVLHDYYYNVQLNTLKSYFNMISCIF